MGLAEETIMVYKHTAEKLKLITASVGCFGWGFYLILVFEGEVVVVFVLTTGTLWAFFSEQ